MRVALPLLLALTIPLRDCCFPCWSSSAPPADLLGVPFYTQTNDYYCTEATIQMWSAYHDGALFWTQDQIYDQMAALDPSDVGPYGSSPAAVAAGVNALVVPAALTYYVDMRQGMSDQQKGISNGSPTIAIVSNGFHADIVMGASWHQLSSLQPSDDFVWVHDPDPAIGGAQIGHTVGDWMTVANACDSSGAPCMASIQVSGQASSAGDELSTFDEWGGTYYGEDDPPDGCDGCIPDALPNPSQGSLARLVSGLGHLLFKSPYRAVAMNRANVRSGMSAAHSPQHRVALGPGKADHGIRKYVYVPYPNSTDEKEIVANFEAAIRQTHLIERAGWEDLDPATQRVRVSSVEHVDSLDRGYNNYSLLTVTSSDGSPYALVNMSETGWLQSVALIAGTAATPRDLAWASATLTALALLCHLRSGGLRRKLSSIPSSRRLWRT